MSAVAGGAVAAVLGLGGIAALVLVLWIGSPFPDSGFGGALHISAGLWLLAQGAELVRVDTLAGDPAPVALTPLLLSVLPAWLLFRGAASAVSEAVGPDTGTEGDPYDGPPEGASAHRPQDIRTAALVAGWVLAGYLTPAVAAVVYASGGLVHVDVLSAFHVLLFAAAATACGAWTGCGRPGLADLPHGPWRRYAGEAAAALRAAGIGAGVLLGGGALMGGASLVWHAGAAGRTYAQLSGSASGQISVLLLALGLVPNLAVWAASYALGVGFHVGAGSVVGPAGASGYGLLPGFPLLAALPGTGSSWLGWTTLALPAGAAVTVGWLVGNGGRPLGSTARVAAFAALGLGVGFAVLAAWSGGALGTHQLADFGPTWWLTGGAGLVWTLVIALPLALAVRYHLACPPRPWRSLARRVWSGHVLRLGVRTRPRAGGWLRARFRPQPGGREVPPAPLWGTSLRRRLRVPRLGHVLRLGVRCRPRAGGWLRAQLPAPLRRLLRVTGISWRKAAAVAGETVEEAAGAEVDGAEAGTEAARTEVDRPESGEATVPSPATPGAEVPNSPAPKAASSDEAGAEEAAAPLPGLVPPSADPLPWPSAPPPFVAPPLPELPPSAPPPPAQEPLPFARPAVPEPPAEAPPA